MDGLYHQARRKAQRAEQEKMLLEMKRRQEQERARELEERRQREAEAKRKRLEEAERRREAMLKGKKEQEPVSHETRKLIIYHQMVLT